MCHWALRIWKCGDSFFTKCSSCSFDRAAGDPTNLLNPLHPSIVAVGSDNHKTRVTEITKTSSEKSKEIKTSSKNGGKKNNRYNGKRSRKDQWNNSTKNSVHGATSKPSPSQKILATIDLSSPGSTHTKTVDNAQAVYPRDATTGKTIPIPLSEIGKASRFGDKTLGESGKCNVFEVVLQTKEVTSCPACTKSPRRAKLPAHARGCFGLS